MFGRNKNTSENNNQPAEQAPEAAPQVESPSTPGYTAPKGRPTPSRKEREAARRTPLVPEDRKAAKEAQREVEREYRLKQQKALQTGDERYLPVNDRGPQRRFIRDYVDARFNVGDYMLPVFLLIFVLGLFLPAAAQTYIMPLMWILILLWMLDCWVLWRKVKARVQEKFGTIEPRSGIYTFNRAMMIRRFRLPKPQVRRGEYPN